MGDTWGWGCCGQAGACGVREGSGFPPEQGAEQSRMSGRGADGEEQVLWPGRRKPESGHFSFTTLLRNLRGNSERAWAGQTLSDLTVGGGQYTQRVELGPPRHARALSPAMGPDAQQGPQGVIIKHLVD